MKIYRGLLSTYAIHIYTLRRIKLGAANEQMRLTQVT